MKRRHFVQGAAASVLLPAGVWSYARILPGLVAPDYVFFDERFPMARGFVPSGAEAGRVLAVQSDITALWRDELQRATGMRPLHLRGVTTHSFLFCLRILAAEHAGVESQAARLDQNLLHWTMRTTPRTDYGTTRNG
jgi:hypothetical protein